MKVWGSNHEIIGDHAKLISYHSLLSLSATLVFGLLQPSPSMHLPQDHCTYYRYFTWKFFSAKLCTAGCLSVSGLRSLRLPRQPPLSTSTGAAYPAPSPPILSLGFSFLCNRSHILFTCSVEYFVCPRSNVSSVGQRPHLPCSLLCPLHCACHTVGTQQKLVSSRNSELWSWACFSEMIS